MTRLRALVLDDEWLARKYLAQLIEATALAEVVGAVATVGEALRVLREAPVDVVFVDLHLAGGEEGLDVIRSVPAGVNRPVFVLATAFPQRTRHLRDLGVADCLLKPFSEERVEQCLLRLGRKAGTC